MDADEIMAKQVEELEKEKKELQVRLKAQEKKVDDLERAKRLEEIPLLKLQFEEFKEEAKVVWEEQEKDRIEGEKKQRASDVENRNRLVRMKTDKEKYLESLLEERKKELKRDEESGCEKRKKKSKGEEMNWQLRKGKNVKLEKQLRNNVKKKNMRRKKLNLKKLRERKGKRSGRSKKDSKGNGKRGMIKIGMIGEGLTEVLGELVVQEGMMMVPGVVEEPGEEVEVVGGIGRKGKKTNGDQEVEMIDEEMMMVPDVDPHEEGPHLQEEDPLHQETVLEVLMEVDGAEEMPLLEDHHPDACRLGVVEVEMSLEEMMGQGGALLQGGISEIGMVDHGDLALEMMGQEEEIVADHVEVEEILATEEALLQDVWVIALRDVDLLHEEIMAVMTIVEAHLRDVVLHVEVAVIMDLLIGAENDLPLEMTLLLVNLVKDQPVTTKMMAGLLSNVKGHTNWE